MPIIKERNKLLHKVKLNGGDDEVLKHQCTDTRSNVKKIVGCAKEKLIEHLVHELKRINTNPKMAWDDIKIFKDDFANHHVKKNVIKFKDENGALVTLDAENAF